MEEGRGAAAGKGDLGGLRPAQLRLDLGPAGTRARGLGSRAAGSPRCCLSDQVGPIIRPLPPRSRISAASLSDQRRLALGSLSDQHHEPLHGSGDRARRRGRARVRWAYAPARARLLQLPPRRLQPRLGVGARELPHQEQR